MNNKGENPELSPEEEELKKLFSQEREKIEAMHARMKTIYLIQRNINIHLGHGGLAEAMPIHSVIGFFDAQSDKKDIEAGKVKEAIVDMLGESLSEHDELHDLIRILGEEGRAIDMKFKGEDTEEDLI